MAFVALYDACVLYPAPIRDLLDTLQAAGLVQTVARLRQLLE